MKTILVVDDNHSIGEYLGELLEIFGFNTVVCDNGKDAVAHIGLVDGIITDFSMPGMNGVELIKIARRLKPYLPMILVTGNILEVPEEHLADKVIGKPFRNEDIKLWLDSI